MFNLLNEKFTTVARAQQITGLSYVGNVSHSSKLMKTQKNQGELVYGIYLTPANTSGRQVCQGASKYCKAACLNMSGRNGIFYDNRIQKTRIKKTILMLTYSTFMFDWITKEIQLHRQRAEHKGYSFSVRINCTSDLDLTKFKNSNKLNLFEQFPDVQFYDYTKVFSRISLMQEYPNYDLTFSFNGINWKQCVEALRNGIRVAVVFSGKLPKYFESFEVINGDNYDTRYYDPKNVIVGLVFKRVRERIDLSNTPFVISLNDEGRNNNFVINFVETNTKNYGNKKGQDHKKHLQICINSR
jgi:hypothetical protein